ncbi:hypothetical protein LA366_02530 [Aeromonas jandaei]|uniref:Uncharacterized protein n=1 Tax=Aeromonas jandaei TaxID=650 RepID=A0A7T4DN28_AERJA|nr:hypothetical protein [Aeromonas jandaei]QQB19310.1 hypothetical protein I6H43_17585 [Aeromonas jandaei]UCA33984.1 hypothetical protein LA366_02530 [Aeromonas jandaei]
MTIEPKALGASYFSTSDLCHCPRCGSELRTGTDDRSFECSWCYYTEQEVVNA